MPITFLLSILRHEIFSSNFVFSHLCILVYNMRVVGVFIVVWIFVCFFPCKWFLFLPEPDPAEEFTEPAEVESTEVLFAERLSFCIPSMPLTFTFIPFLIFILVCKQTIHGRDSVQQ